MSDVNQKCVSLANGALGPDLRVNYEYGLILGVAEFRQEQLHRLEGVHAHHRALHGYGTAVGLEVQVERPPDNPHELLIRVERGMGVDQPGRMFVVRTAQCARLGAWLAARERQQPGTIAQHLGPSGELHIYVVASYDECLEALVPIPGQPCSSSESTQAPSRIRDAYNIELRWEPPAMPAWDTVRRFAHLMAAVRIVPGLLPHESDEAEIVQLVRALDQPSLFDLLGGPLVGGSGLLGSPPDVLRLPADAARAALDRIFTVWVTEVRPRLLPDAVDPSFVPGGGAAEASILLARIDIVPDDPFDLEDPRLVDFSPPDDEGRPYLLHTQLIQELLLLGEGTEVQVTMPPQPLRSDRELATIDLRVENAAQRLVLWFHTDAPVRLPPALAVVRNSTPSASYATTPRGGGPFAAVWELTPPPGVVLADGDLLEISVPTDDVRVGNDATSLSRLIAERPLPFVNWDGALTILLFHAVELPAPPPPPAVTRPTTPFVTLTPQGIRTIGNIQFMVIELWFHLDADPKRDVAAVARLNAESAQQFITVLAEVNQPLGTGLRDIPIRRVIPRQNNVFEVAFRREEWRARSGESPYLRFLFDLRLPLETLEFGELRLREYIRQLDLNFVGRHPLDPDGPIVAYVRAQGQP
jgi:hypothetical protein